MEFKLTWGYVYYTTASSPPPAPLQVQHGCKGFMFVSDQVAFFDTLGGRVFDALDKPKRGYNGERSQSRVSTYPAFQVGTGGLN